MDGINEDLNETIYEAITKVLSVYIKEIRDDSTFYGDLGADSIDMVQIIKCIEESIDADLSDVDINSIETVSDLYEAVSDYI